MSIDFESLFGDNGRQSGPDRPRPRRIWYVLLLLFGLAMGMRMLVGLYIDALWFESLGQSALFRTRLLAPLGAFAAAFLVGLIWLAGHWLWAARRLAGRDLFPGQRASQLARAGTRPLVLGVAALAAGLIAVGTAGAWQTLLLYTARGEFGQIEPILGRDVGFYAFELPFWRLVHGLANSWLLTALLGAALIYLLGGAIEAGGALRRESGKQQRGASGRIRRIEVAPGVLRAARRHLSLLGALYALVLAAGAWLSRFEQLTRGRADSVFFGPGYADVTARMPALAAVAGLWLLVALILVFGAFRGGPWLGIGTAVVVLGLQLVGAELYPGLVQQYRVKPNELAREGPYIETGIELTRAAWGLTTIEEVDYEPTSGIDRDALDANRGTLDNVRLWDWQVLLDYFEQKQAIRPYHDFRDVDIDRYPTADGVRQVELSARELQPAGLRNPTWISRHLEYTHGYGLAMVPVDEVDGRGQPVLWAQDLPVRTNAPFERPLEQPRIYFGEGAGVPYVIVGTRTDEFDYPVGDENARTVYEGSAGVRVGGPLRRLALALHFGDIEILLSNDVEADSRVLMRRQIGQRLRQVAPFLIFDGDPYLVLTEAGRMVWMADAYTATDRYPYAEPMSLSNGSGMGRVNYLRNSVKVVVDAYEGRPRFYVVDEVDPILRAWRQVFPGLFEEESMPEDLVAHWRYPELLFRAQSSIYERYHVERPDVFYNGEDLWSVPMETRAQGDTQPMEPYYVTMRLRGEAEPEFLLMLPYAPAGKKNMIAWLAARSDPGVYGQLVLYNFGKGRQIDGPEQIESRIDNNTDISAQLTLWSQAGSNTIRGNLLVIPIDDSLLYVEPLYLQAESNALPELKRVIVADGDRVEMRETFEEALAALVGDIVADMPLETEVDSEIEPDDEALETAADVPPPLEELGALPAELGALIRSARQAETAAGEALRAGDWQGFGRQMDRLSRALEALAELEGSGGGPEDQPADEDASSNSDDGGEAGDSDEAGEAGDADEDDEARLHGRSAGGIPA